MLITLVYNAYLNIKYTHSQGVSVAVIFPRRLSCASIHCGRGNILEEDNIYTRDVECGPREGTQSYP